MSKTIQNVLMAFIMASSVTALYDSTSFEWVEIGIFNISLLFIAILFFYLISTLDIVVSYFCDKHKVEKELKPIFEKVEEICEINSQKVLDAFQDCNLSEMHLNTSTVPCSLFDK